MPQPPATLTLRYCATCGWQSATHAGSHVAGDTFNLCDGAVQTLTYRLDAGQPERESEPQYEYVTPADLTAGDEVELYLIASNEGWEYCAAKVLTIDPLRVRHHDGPDQTFTGKAPTMRRRTAPNPPERLDVPDTTKET